MEAPFDGLLLDADNRARARARDKQRKPISLEEKHENFIRAVRK